jgi:hypothetical protein
MGIGDAPMDFAEAPMAIAEPPIRFGEAPMANANHEVATACSPGASPGPRSAEPAGPTVMDKHRDLIQSLSSPEAFLGNASQLVVFSARSGAALRGHIGP